MIRILLVDDRKTSREFLKASLRSTPDIQIVGIANDGHTAIEQVEILQPDIVLMDAEMPDLDGLAATQIICQRFSMVRVIILSMHESDDYVIKAFQVGAMGYLSKSSSAKEIEEAIRLVYGGSTQIGTGLLSKELRLSQLEQTLPIDPAKPKEKLLKVKANGSLTEATNVNNSNNRFLSRFNWKSYPVIWLIANSLLWSATVAYLMLKSPTYKSEWAISLPVGRSSTNVNLPNIGNASSQSDSPFSNSEVSDPRENYKFLIETQEVREAAAKLLDTPTGTIEKPEINIVNNTTLMRLSTEGETPLKAYKKALALQNALEARLNQLREQQIEQQDWKLQRTLKSSRKQLQEAQKKLSEHKARVPVSTKEQMQDLSSNIENLRRQQAEAEVELKQVDASLQELSSNLGMSVTAATDAFMLQSDPLFQQYSSDYSRINGELVNLGSKFQPKNPVVIEKQAEKDAALSALLERGRSILRKPISAEFLEQLSLNNANSSDSNKAVLFQELISLQTQKEGLKNRANELEQQIENLESRLSSLSPQESTLANLQRDVDIAEAIFSSTMTKLDLSKSEIFAYYPQIQMITQPNIPEEPSSPKMFVLIGSSMGSFFLTTGLFLLWWRDRQNRRENQQIISPQVKRLPSFDRHDTNTLSHNNSVSSKK